MPHLVIGTAGHIDHGKSALVRALTGTDPDRLEEEKARGITIDLGFALMAVGDLRVSFVDVPGHERFVKNMLAGATGIDAVALVVAGDESVMPQTREHFDICRLLGVSHGLAVITKADLVDEDTIELVTLEVRDLVRGSFLERGPVIPVSSVTGAGLDALRAAVADIAGRVTARAPGGLPRLPIDRVFSVKGFGTVVTGTLVSGSVRLDQDLVLLPSGRPVKVRGLQAHGRSLSEAHAAQRLAVNLAGIEVGDIERGETLAGAGAFRPSRIIDAGVEVLPSAKPLRHGARVRFHLGTGEVLGRVAVSGCDADGEEGAVQQARAVEVPPGRRAHVRIRLEGPAVATRGDRFVLRAYSPPHTIAGGIVLDPLPARGPIRTRAGRERFARIDGTGEAGTVAFVGQVVSEQSGRGLTVDEVATRTGLGPAALHAVVDTLVRAGTLRRVGAELVASAVLNSLSARLLDAVRAYHQQQPLSEGLPREEARSRVFTHASDEVFASVVGGLVEAGRVRGRERLALPEHRLPLSEDDHRAIEGVATGFERAGLLPPETPVLAAAIGVPEAAVTRAVTLLLRQKVLVRVDTLLFHARALDRLKEEIRGLKGTPAGQRLDVSAVKDRYGLSRKYAIPLLEYLDRERVTRRVGEARIVL
jgi:selenocysteine-specific elongation factor